MTRNQFLQGIGYIFGSLTKFLIFSVLVIFISFVVFNTLLSLFYLSVPVWMLVSAVALIYLFSAFVKYSMRKYLEKYGDEGKRNLLVFEFVLMLMLFSFGIWKFFIAIEVQDYESLGLWTGAILYLLFEMVRMVRFELLNVNKGEV